MATLHPAEARSTPGYLRGGDGAPTSSTILSTPEAKSCRFPGSLMSTLVSWRLVPRDTSRPSSWFPARRTIHQSIAATVLATSNTVDHLITPLANPNCSLVSGPFCDKLLVAPFSHGCNCHSLVLCTNALTPNP